MSDLFSNLDPQRGHEVGIALAWHGRMMVLAWVFLVPIGVLSARFFKILPSQDWPRELGSQIWWRFHIWTLWTATAAITLALVLTHWVSDPFSIDSWHGVFGYAAAVLFYSQIVSTWFRGTAGGPRKPAPDGSWRGDHYDMTPRRVLFELWHKHVGYVAYLVSVAAIYTGLWQANAPIWMLLIVVICWIATAMFFAYCQIYGWSFDSYQSMWGPGKEHPGNHRKPIGFWITRPIDRSHRD